MRQNLSRRALLKSAAAPGGTTAGSGASGGFPTIWARNIKDIAIRHVGSPVAAIPAIAAQANKDLDFTIQMQAAENTDLLNRLLTGSEAIDCADISVTFLKYLVGRNVSRAIPLAKANDWDRTISLFTKGEYLDGRKVSRQGIAPYGVIHATDLTGQKLHDGPSEWLTGLKPERFTNT